MITKTINLYTIDELKKDAQRKAIDNWNANDDLFFMRSDMQLKLKELLADYKIEGDGKVWYSLSYSQGDGAMFDGLFVWKGYNFKITHVGRYYHFNSKNIWIEDDEGNDKSEYEDEFDPIYKEICQKLERFGYDLIEQAQSDENVMEEMRINECYFTEDGKATPYEKN